MLTPVLDIGTPRRMFSTPIPSHDYIQAMQQALVGLTSSFLPVTHCCAYCPALQYARVGGLFHSVVMLRSQLPEEDIEAHDGTMEQLRYLPRGGITI